MDDAATQPQETGTSAPEAQDSRTVNQQMAADQNGPDAEIVECPTCHNPRRKFLIVDDKCDSCRTKDQASAIIPELGWPEVRARRNRLITQTDWTQLADVDPAVSGKYAPLRVRLRDVTEQPDPFAAWYELDAIEAELAK